MVEGRPGLAGREGVRAASAVVGALEKHPARLAVVLHLYSCGEEPCEANSYPRLREAVSGAVGKDVPTNVLGGHLQILRSAGLVTSRRVAIYTYCWLTPLGVRVAGPLAELARVAGGE